MLEASRYPIPLLVAVLSGCSDPARLIDVSAIAPGADCLAGGHEVRSGLDLDRSGTLDASEVDQRDHLCHGIDGEDGADGSDGASGRDGANGEDGANGSDGLDGADGRDGANGADGEDGTDGGDSLLTFTEEAPGVNCENGGERVDAGVDDDGDGVLDESEIDATEYICDGADGSDGANGSDGIDGADGRSSLLAVTDEPAGANCAGGGVRVDSGIDDDGDGTLDPVEVDATEYVCDGSHADSLFALVPVDPGDACAYGGERLDFGDDADGSGVLDPGEIAASVYFCDDCPTLGEFVDFATFPTGSFASLVVPQGFGVRGSADVTVTVDGLGVLGGELDARVDSTEHLDLEFDEPVDSLTYRIGVGGDDDLDGIDTEQVVTAWDADGAELGTVTLAQTGWQDVSATFGGASISALRIEADGDGFAVAEVNFERCEPAPEP